VTPDPSDTDLAPVAQPTLEIERKYLLSALPPRVAGCAVLEVEQGYLPGVLIKERIRRTTQGHLVRWYRTFKSGFGLVREEIEEETTARVFEAMWPLTEGRRIRKRRYLVPEGSLIWEIDEFLDQELVLAEVELPSATVIPPIPEWLRPVLVAEVTGDRAYNNSLLAR
jgi:CYTH domain-containing protein